MGRQLFDKASLAISSIVGDRAGAASFTIADDGTVAIVKWDYDMPAPSSADIAAAMAALPG